MIDALYRDHDQKNGVSARFAALAGDYWKAFTEEGI